MRSETQESNPEESKKHRDLPPDDFRKYAHEAADWVAQYLENMDEYPVLAQTTPGEIKSKLPKHPPDKSEPFQDILSDFRNIILPGVTHWNHPRFFAYFSITGSYPGIIGEMLCSALNVNAMLWKASPSATELEEVVVDWMRQMLGLPEEFEGGIYDTASIGSLCAIAAARESANLQIREKGLAGRNDLRALRMYASEEAHSSIEKAAIVLGFGQEGIRKIPTDEAFRMNLDALEQAVKEDIEAGRKPICVVATIGTTSTTSVDPVKEISELCRKHGMWLHVDAAYGGAAALIPDKLSFFAGWQQADSIIVNPHKWLFTPLDCSLLYCRRPEVLKQAFSLTPEYLRTAEAGGVKNFMDYGVSLGRRFRALKLWMVIRSLGQNGIANAIQEHISYANRLADMIQAHRDFELLVPVPFSTLVFRYNPNKHVENASALSHSEINDLNERLLEAINQTGRVFLSHTKLKGNFGIRLAIGNLKTTWRDIELAWETIQQKATELSVKAN
jgi:aromatic-L-amino-acid decarboxylase